MTEPDGCCGVLYDLPQDGDLAEGTVVTTYFVGVEAATGAPQFALRSSGDAVFTDYMKQAFAELGLTVEDVNSGDLDAMSRKVDQFHMKIDLEKLEGSFEEKMIAIAKVWHALDDEAALRLLSQAKADPRKSILELLHENRVITDQQLAILQEGKNLIDSGILDFRKMAIAYKDELDGSITFHHALDLRRWRDVKQ